MNYFWIEPRFSDPITFYKNLVTVNQYLHRKDALSVAFLEDKPSFGAGNGIRFNQRNQFDYDNGAGNEIRTRKDFSEGF